MSRTVEIRPPHVDIPEEDLDDLVQVTALTERR